MNIKYIENEKVETDELIALYNSVGWVAYTDNRKVMENILENSHWYLTVFHDEKLIGLLRVVGDGYSIVYIQDILVNPKYQRMGIGRYLMERTLEKFSNIRQTVLITDDEEKTKAFYNSVGLKPVEETYGKCFVKYNI